MTQTDTNIVRSATPVTLDSTDVFKRLGLVLLSTDLTTERDYRRVLPFENLGVYSTRVAFENPTTPQNLMQMSPGLTAAAALLPADEPLAAICYSCTAASVVIGDDQVKKSIQKACPNVPVVTPSQSAVHAFAALGVTRISVLTPYLVETSEPMAAYFTKQGIDIQRFECLGMQDDREMAYVSEGTLIQAACAADDPNSQALFISCTALPVISVIDEIEKRIAKPVVSSNQATIWAMLQHAEVTKAPIGFGQLFSRKMQVS
jgi:maleate isomerase